MIADGKRRVFVTLDKRVIEALDVLARSRQVHRSTVIADAVAAHFEVTRHSAGFDEVVAMDAALGTLL